ncbi:hypothetical protein CJJ23_02895 [Mycoplasmopsis agassizii]|uniref:ECF transporter S component n=1 Tax=Mycoplasmopsis agassizii TaxID=33922 RepID=A0A269TJB0_9BACT|nr:ECF transporter S component [Mycoplasmopsis agassizii]PAK21270.1 hypothetical protein CJJ23_02895 [Mycoplasmopsis agassizii]
MNNSTSTKNQWLDKQTLKDFFKNQIRFTTFDVALAGILMAIAIIVNYITNLSLTGVLNIDAEVIFSIFFGIIFGPLKGSFLSVVLDHLNLLVRGRIGFWMWEYAIIALLLPMIAWFFFNIRKIKSNLKAYLPVLIVIVTIIMAYSLFFNLANPFSTQRVDGFNQRFSYTGAVIAITVATALILIATFHVGERYLITKKAMYIDVLIIVSLVVFVQVLFRWLWGPFAFINYLHRFTRNVNNRTYENSYTFYMIPIVIKTMITIPLFSFVLAASVPSLIYFEHKYKIKNKMALKAIFRRNR